VTVLEAVKPIWRGGACIVAATGPSLTPEVAAQCQQSGLKIIAVNDAYTLIPHAEILYACDGPWWDVHQGCPQFAGEKWSSHQKHGNDKLVHAKRYGLRLVAGKAGKGFSTDPEMIHYGSNSGFQAINLAILFGAVRIILVGFNMQAVAGRAHFFGDHKGRLNKSVNYTRFVGAFNDASTRMPKGVRIVNATPKSALKCFPIVSLEQAFADASPRIIEFGPARLDSEISVLQASEER
jgi:hypothetical protein